jgi:hypothetical protein
VGDVEEAYSMRDIMGSWGQVAVQRFEQSHGIDLADAMDGQKLPFGREFQEDILAWHIATEMFISRVEQKRLFDKENVTLVEAIKTLSRYLMFLVVVREHMLPGLVLRSLFEVTRKALNEIWIQNRRYYPSCSRSEKEDLVMIIRREGVQGSWGSDDPKTRLMYDGAVLARALRKLGAVGIHLRNEIIRVRMPDLLELIFNVWVDKLVYASTRGSTDSHIKQLSSGGELTTVIWIMAQHAGTFRIGELRRRDPEPPMSGEFRKGKHHIGIPKIPAPPELAMSGEFGKGKEKQEGSSVLFSSSDTQVPSS